MLRKIVLHLIAITKLFFVDFFIVENESVNEIARIMSRF